MAVVLESYTYGEDTSAGSPITVNVNKPTGLSVGNLLVAFWGTNTLQTRNTPSGWTQLSTSANYGYISKNMGVYTKIADAGDVVASTFAFSTSGNAGQQVASQIALIRVSGQSLTQPVNTYSINPSPVSNTLTPTIDNDITPYANNLIIMGICSGGDAAMSVSNESIETDNPTWTEIIDEETNFYCLAIAHTNRVQNTSTGNTSFTVAYSGTLNRLNSNAILVSIPSNQNFTVSEILSLSEAKLLDISLTKTDSLYLSESLTYSIGRVWRKVTKPVTNWINKQKN